MAEPIGVYGSCYICESGILQSDDGSINGKVLEYKGDKHKTDTEKLFVCNRCAFIIQSIAKGK